MNSTVDARPGSVASRTLISAGWLVAWRMATQALGLVSTLVLARILVPADFGLGWQRMSMASLPALLVGCAIGLVAIVLFAAAQSALWQASGRPNGPEQRMLDLAAKAFASLNTSQEPRTKRLFQGSF